MIKLEVGNEDKLPGHLPGQRWLVSATCLGPGTTYTALQKEMAYGEIFLFATGLFTPFYFLYSFVAFFTGVLSSLTYFPKAICYVTDAYVFLFINILQKLNKMHGNRGVSKDPKTIQLEMVGACSGLLSTGLQGGQAGDTESGLGWLDPIPSVLFSIFTLSKIGMFGVIENHLGKISRALCGTSCCYYSKQEA